MAILWFLNLEIDMLVFKKVRRNSMWYRFFSILLVVISLFVFGVVLLPSCNNAPHSERTLCQFQEGAANVAGTLEWDLPCTVCPPGRSCSEQVAHNAFLVWIKEGDFDFLGGFLEQLYIGGYKVLDIEELDEWVGTPKHCFIIIVDSEYATGKLGNWDWYYQR
jgi:hypothetical protein